MLSSSVAQSENAGASLANASTPEAALRAGTRNAPCAARTPRAHQSETAENTLLKASFSETSHSSPALLPTRYTPAAPALRAVFAARAAGVPLTVRDVSPDMMEAIRQQWGLVQHALQPVTELHVAAWLKKLSQLVTNPPGAETAASQCRAIFDVCGDIPSGAWGRDARLAWARQPPRNGYPTGARWPSPNELRSLLLPFAETIRRDAEGCRALLRLHSRSDAIPQSTTSQTTAPQTQARRPSIN
ncbi:hypothetical protein [Acetobacter senegalensis]|uniref:hypothetical protein n=1 Tax=Acetobacter senegalensis TaxID=446692 RepID=UPI0026533D91|nr:hypothetical protein [Acetobacter senegalensis]MDN7351451.1 hypothetical protein [Acetobacter senegalensis]